MLYLIEILHQTTTSGRQRVPQKCCILSKFYIKPQRLSLLSVLATCCILSKFYIKPQLSISDLDFPLVVSYRNSTSNHNSILTLGSVFTLYLIEILHQTTTSGASAIRASRLYLIEILHQTTTAGIASSFATALYLIEILHQTTTTVEDNIVTSMLYLIEILHQTTTSSCHDSGICSCILSKFYIKPQPTHLVGESCFVVSYRNSTSNHNRRF